MVRQSIDYETLQLSGEAPELRCTRIRVTFQKSNTSYFGFKRSVVLKNIESITHIRYVDKTVFDNGGDQ